MKAQLENKHHKRVLIRKCHVCGQMTETTIEQQKCVSCGKSFLPLNYFAKIHGQENINFNKLFAESDELQEEDLITGLYVLW